MHQLKLLLLTLVLLLPSYALAQQKKEEPPKTPEPEIGTLEKEWTPVVMQHYIGIRGGIGSGTGRFEPLRENIAYSGLLNFGIAYRFDAPKQKYVGCIEANLNYMEKGYKYETYIESGIVESRKYSMIELPILWQPYLPLSSKNDLSRIFLSAGPYLGYAIDSHYQIYELESGNTIDEGKYYFNSSRDNRFEYGIVVGGGIQIGYKRLLIAAEFRYNIMLSDTFKGVTKYPGNPFRSPIDQMNISIGIYYKLTQKAIEVAK